MANDRFDLGAVLTLTGTAIATGYTDSTAFQAGSASGISLWAKLITDAASNLTSVTVKLEASYDGALWAAVQSTRQDTGVTAAEHAFTVAANASVSKLVLSSNAERARFVRVSGKANAAGVAGDSVTIYCTAW